VSAEINYAQLTEDSLKAFAGASDQFTRFWQDLASRDPQKEASAGQAMMQDVAEAYKQAWQQLYANPENLLARQVQMQKQLMELWQETVLKFTGEVAQVVTSPDRSDKRFADPDWENNPLFNYIKQFYLIQSRHLTEMVDSIEGLPANVKQQVSFFTRQYVNALAPTNFLTTNPEVLRKTFETQGANLRDGMEQFLADLKNSYGGLNVSMTDTAAFRVGENVATTSGKVVFQNDLMQLIQFEPTSEKVFKKPLLVIPPFINKYYILDLREKNSYLKWLVDQGHTVFCISWVNPGPSLKHKSFDDYLLEGPVAALDAIEQATGEKEVNAVGYCVGGTLLAAVLSWLKSKGQEKRISTATFLTTLIDFRDPGEISVFINESAIAALEKQMDQLGYFDGRIMSFSFNLLRENDLFWSFYVNNYLKGERPAAFDLLYWNSDSTNLPPATHSWYLRNMYLQNSFCEKGVISVAGEAMDVSQIDTSSYFISTEQDHIARWKSTYFGAAKFAKTPRFVLGGSGHIAGVVNPPASNKYGYRVIDAEFVELPDDPEQWLAQTVQHEGSWWTDWQRWVEPQAGKKVAARKPGGGKLEVIEDAPGRYAQTRLSEAIRS